MAHHVIPFGRKRTVAVIDDNRTNRTILQRYLSSWGLREHTFESGVEALKEMQVAASGDEPAGP